MIPLNQMSWLIPVLPEIVLACAAMLMLMVGVYIVQSERSAAIVNGWCVAMLLLVGGILLAVPAGRYELFGGSFVVDDFARFLKLLAPVPVFQHFVDGEKHFFGGHLGIGRIRWRVAVAQAAQVVRDPQKRLDGLHARRFVAVHLLAPLLLLAIFLARAGNTGN